MLDMIKNFLGQTEEEEELEPKKYKIEVSGWPEGVDQRISEYISSASQKGATHLEITADHPNSFTPHDVEEIKTFHKQEDVNINIHGTMRLRTARAGRRDYERVEVYMKGYIKKAKEIGADYINIHTSAYPSPELLRPTRARKEMMLAPGGEEIEEFIENLDKNSEAFIWLANELQRVYRLIRNRAENEVARDILEEEDVESEEEAKRRYEELSEEERERRRREVIAEEIEEEWIPLEDIMNELRTYKLIGWWMYEKNDPLWKKICGEKSPEDLEEEEEREEKEAGTKKLVDAVSGKYIQGHIENLKEEIEKSDVTITLETPDARETELLGYYRLIKPSRIYHVMKVINHPQVRLCIDFEHIATHGIDPKEALEDSPRNLGKYVEVVHLSSNPSPGHAHKPVGKGEKYLYEMLWILRKKGFEGGYLNFERGGGEEEEIWEESIPRVKEMAMFLEDDVKPKDLPAEFYGYTDWEFKHDKAVVKSHMFDPIRGLVESPELQDTFLGRHATEEGRMRREDWEREEHQ